MHESLDQEIQTLQSIFWSERDPDGLAFASLADAFRRKGEVREALDLLTDGMSRHPDFVTGHAIATKLYHDQGMDFEAELAARRVLELDPENLVGLSTLSDLLTRKGETGEAEEIRSTLLAVDPGSDEARATQGGAPAEITELVPEAEDREEPTDSLLDELATPGPGADALDSGVPDEELAAAMDSLGLVGEDEMLHAATPSEEDVVPGPEAEFSDLDALVSEEPIDLESVDLGDPLDLVGFATEEAQDADFEDAEPEAMDLGALAPDEPEDAEPEVMDLGALAPDEPEDAEPEVMDLGALAPDEPEDAELEVMDLGALAPDEPDDAEPEVMDLGALAPDEPEDAELEVMDLGALAPDEPDHADPEVMDLGALAPDEPEDAEPEVMDLGALAPDEPEDAELEVMDLGALAPDEPEDAELEVMDLGALAPDEPDDTELEVMDLGALAPDEPEDAELEVMDLGALAPDEPEDAEPEVMDLGALAPDEPEDAEPEVMDLGADGGATEMSDEPAEPIYTRTLADLYIKQGFDDKALEVLKALQARNPGDTELGARISALEAGETPEIELPEPQIPGDGHSEDEVEERARELAEHGRDGAEVGDTPFAWDSDASDEGDPDEPAAGNYFDELLGWENRAES